MVAVPAVCGSLFLSFSSAAADAEVITADLIITADGTAAADLIYNSTSKLKRPSWSTTAVFYLDYYNFNCI